MLYEEKDFDACLDDVVRVMNQKTVWCVTREMVVKITKDNPRRAIYAAHVGNVTIVCKAYRGGNFSVKCIGW